MNFIDHLETLSHSIWRLYDDPVATQKFIQFCTSHENIYFITLGKNKFICEGVCSVAQSLGIHWRTLDAVDCFHGASGVFRDGDGMVFVSKNGRTKEVLAAWEQYGVEGHQYMITAAKVHYKLPIIQLSIEDEGSPFGLAPMASMVIFNTFLNGVLCEVFDAKGITKEQYLEHHPAGAIGEALRSH